MDSIHRSEKAVVLPGCRVHSQDAAVPGSPRLPCKESGKTEHGIVRNGAEPPPCGRKEETEGKDGAVRPVLQTVSSASEDKGHA